MLEQNDAAVDNGKQERYRMQWCFGIGAIIAITIEGMDFVSRIAGRIETDKLRDAPVPRGGKEAGDGH